jgi:CheY-like chemotaxis protein
VTEELRKIEKGGKRVPIIALTANVVEEDEDKHKKAGMNGYLSKPIRIKDIEDVLQKYL